MVNNIIASLSCAVMLREEDRGGRQRARVLVEDVPVTFKNLGRLFFLRLRTQASSVPETRVTV